MNLTELKPAPYSSRAFLPASIIAGWDCKENEIIQNQCLKNSLIQYI